MSQHTPGAEPPLPNDVSQGWLPEWYAHVHQFLPFAPAANLVRSTLFDIGPIQILDVIVVGFWGLLGCASALWALARRD